MLEDQAEPVKRVREYDGKLVEVGEGRRRAIPQNFTENVEPAQGGGVGSDGLVYGLEVWDTAGMHGGP